MKLFKNKVNRASENNYLKTQTNSNKLVNFINQNKISLVVILLLLVGAFSVQYFNKTSYALSEPVTGTLGTCSWTIDTNGKLTIEPQSESNTCTLALIGSKSGQPWHRNKADITSVKVSQGVIPNANSSYLFYGLTNATQIDVDNLDTSNVTNMGYMFQMCSSLTKLDVTKFNTSSVTNMGYMFSGCSKLTELDVTNFNTSSVTKMDSMFYSCSKLTELNVTHFDTTSATVMNGMFSDCSSLTELDVTGFNTSSVKLMNAMFAGCSSLTELDVTGFNTSSVTNMLDMFSDCRALTELDVTGFNTSSVTNMSYMFSDCRSLTELDLSNFVMTGVTNVSCMFDNIGKNQNQGSKLTLNKTFDNVTYAKSSGYWFPWTYYSKETNGTLSSNLYTLAQMQTEVTGSNTATTWVPAYSVTYDGNGGTINSNNTLVKTYRIGSKINAKNVTPVKTSYDFIKWNNSSNGNGSLTINKNGESANAYGTKYSTTGLNNGNITLYAQYNLPVSDVEFIKKDNVTGDPVNGASFSLTGTSDAGESVSKTATSTSTGKVTFTDVPFGTYTVHETTVPSGYSSNNLRDFTVKVQR